MNNPRLFLWLALAFLLFINYETWLRDYAPRTPVPESSQLVPLDPANPVAPGAATQTPAVPATGNLDTVPEAPTPAAAAAGDAAAAPAAANGEAPGRQAGIVHVVTDVIDLDIGLLGGELSRADLLSYPVEKNRPDVPVRIFRREGRDALYVLQTGLSGPAGAGARPTHQTVWTSGTGEYRLDAGADELRVPLTWNDGQGVTVTKTFVFRRGQYRIEVDYAVENGSTAAWAAAPYAQIWHEMPPVERSYFDVTSYAFEGPAMWDGKSYRKLDIGDDDDAQLERRIDGGWIAALQHHFLGAIVTPANEQYVYRLRARGHQYAATTIGPQQSIAPGAQGSFRQTLFVGPKLQQQLAVTGPELERAADYGTLHFLAKPLFWLMEKVHALVGNWGVTIIIVTFLLKLAFYPLSEMSGKSMAKMKVLAPRMKNLQETYKDDREKLGRAMMDLYKREKVNPAVGCVPMLIQIPVFLAFYWVLLESVELRQAPFALWLQDLSSRDPFFILPLIMAGAMFLQYRLQPTPADPVQQKVFMFLPIVMSVTFAFFPAGLVLYWVTNTILTIAQQWNINRRIEAGAKARTA